MLSSSDAPQRRTGYVLKMYPRFSETFVLTELLARERGGDDLEVLSLRAPVDGRFHPELAALRAPVTYVPGGDRVASVWDALRSASQVLPDLAGHLPSLLAAEPGDAVQALRVAEAARRRGITHLHAHFASVAADVAMLAARLAGISWSFTAHAKDIYHQDVDPEALRRKLREAHHVVTVSDFNLAHLRREYGGDAAGVTRVYNGLDLAAFQWSLPARRPAVVAAVGRLVEKKGWDVLLDALAVLRRRGVAVRCVLAGAGPLEGELRARRDALGLTEVVSLPGPLPQDQVRELVASSAVLAAPCVVGSDGNRDGLPTVVLEAMALGTTVVSTDVTGLPEVVRHEDTGLVVAQHDPVALADALARLLVDEDLRCALAVRARLLVESSFDSRAQAGRLRALEREHGARTGARLLRAVGSRP